MKATKYEATLQEVLSEFPKESPQEILSRTSLALEQIEKMIKSEIQDLQNDCNDLLRELADPPIDSESDKRIPFVFFRIFVEANKYDTLKCESEAQINLTPDGATLDEVLLKIAYGYYRKCSVFIEAIDLYNKSDKYVNWKNIIHKEIYGRALLRAQGRLQNDSESDEEFDQLDDSDEWTDIDE